MKSSNWFLGCAVVLGLLLGNIEYAVAQDDPFGVNAVEVDQTLITPAQPTPALAVDPADDFAADPTAISPADPTPELAVDPALADVTPTQAALSVSTNSSDDLCRCIGEESSASADRIREALRQPLARPGIEFVDQPLEEIVGLLSEEYNIPLRLDTKAMEAIGVPNDAPVSITLHGISLHAALRILLNGLGLTYVIQNEVLMITTPDEAEKQLQVCVYQVSDILASSNSSQIDSLVDAIVSCVATTSWRENGGGNAEVKILKPSMLVISQTQAVHHEIRGLLDAIRRARGLPGAQTNAVQRGAEQVAAAPDDGKAITRVYYLQAGSSPSTDVFVRKIGELIARSLPDEQWSGRLENGDPIVLTIFPDRVVLRHRGSTQEAVESLLIDSGLAAAPADVAGQGGYGDGFFAPRP